MAVLGCATLAIVAVAPPVDVPWPDRALRGDLGVVLPPAPSGTAAPPAAPSSAAAAPSATPAVAVRCRSTSRCLRWRLPPAAPGSGPPALTRDHLLFPSATGLVAVATATGEQVWRTGLERTDAAGLSATAVGDTDHLAVVADRHQRMTAIDATDGTVRWQQEVDGLDAVEAARAVGDDDWLVAARVRGDAAFTTFVAVLGVDGVTGAVQWRQESADAALSASGAVLQDVNGDLTGLTPQGEVIWELTTGRPAARLTPFGDMLLVSGRDGGLVVDLATGAVLDEILGPPSQVRARDDALVWPVAGGIAYRSGGGDGWRADVPEVAGCCSGFVVDTASVTVLTGRGEMIELARADGMVVGRGPAPDRIGADDGRAWLYGDIALTTLPGTGGLARLHATRSGAHLADITSEAYALLTTGSDRWLVLAPGFALTLRPADPTDAKGRPGGSARTR